jgi:hypothetical protein
MKRRPVKRHRLHQPPATAAMVFTCAACWDEWFPGQEPPGYNRDARTCLLHAACAAEFVSSGGFEIVTEIVHGTTILGLFCPHLEEP